MVSLYAAQIHDESKRIIEVIRVVPRQSWCTEVKRFYDEVTNELVALSGMKFFYLTKRLVLSVCFYYYGSKALTDASCYI